MRFELSLQIATFELLYWPHHSGGTVPLIIPALLAQGTQFPFSFANLPSNIPVAVIAQSTTTSSGEGTPEGTSGKIPL